jgi:hypothetical protein
MKNDKMIISWFSAGVSSAIATKYAIDKYGEIKIIYIHIDDQHKDTMRFVNDCQSWFGQEIEILQSEIRDVKTALLKAGFVNSPYGSPCTRILKKSVRSEWERNNNYHFHYIWGYDLNEQSRADRIVASMSDHDHEFPLIDNGICKSTAHGMLERSGINRPEMYDMGYPNNNCIGCVKGGMGYWDAIRRDFPSVFHEMCEVEKTIGGQVFKQFPLSELPFGAGRTHKIIVPDCGLFCQNMD